jgi:hypothetical protein
MPAWEFVPIPAPMIAAVRAAVPALVTAVVDAVTVQSPAYGSVLSAPEGIGIRLGIEQAVLAFLDGAAQGEHPSADTGELWRRLGESEFQAGRELELLRTAFRTGTRALWREAATVAAGTELPTQLVVALAEAIFVYTDELASDVVEGYMRAQSDEAGELERRRRRVAALLMDPDGVDPEALGRAAVLARWPVPRELAVLALASQSPVAIIRRLGSEALVGTDGDGVFLVLPDPAGPGQRALIARAVAGERCALGPTVGVREAVRSLRWSRELLELAQTGVIDSPAWGAGPQVASGGGPEAVRGPAGALLSVEDHLVDLIVLRDSELAAALVESRLGVLGALPATERERLERTLAAWLAHQRHTPAVAAELHVHPQTVRYRIHRLRELLGDALDAPQGRFELELALRVRGVRGGR